jgi:hypothetical protein
MISANPSRTLADAAVGFSETVFDPIHDCTFSSVRRMES